MSDENKGFTVKDRRSFTPGGEPRGSEASQEPEPARPEPVRLSSSAASVGEGEPRSGEEVSFATFLMSLAAQAGGLLQGGAAAQAGGLLEGGAAAELEGARQIVAILEMLQHKTEGRRTPEEDRLLDGLLYDLRMAYVERARMARA